MFGHPKLTEFQEELADLRVLHETHKRPRNLSRHHVEKIMKLAGELQNDANELRANELNKQVRAVLDADFTKYRLLKEICEEALKHWDKLPVN